MTIRHHVFQDLRSPDRTSDPYKNHVICRTQFKGRRLSGCRELSAIISLNRRPLINIPMNHGARNVSDGRERDEAIDNTMLAIGEYRRRISAEFKQEMAGGDLVSMQLVTLSV